MTIEESETESDSNAGFLVLVEYAGELPEAQAIATPSPGFLGASGWTGVGAVEASLRLVHFEDQAAAAEFLRERVENSDEPPRTQAIPPTIHHVAIQHHAGKTLERADVGSYLTSLRVVAAPGYGEVAAQDIEETLESLQLVEGYAGHIQGYSVALPDEIWALVLWNSPPLLPAPPAGDEAQIEHYRRIA
jgi:hypothetical protein